MVASIIPFIRLRYDFDDEVTRIMGEAFDEACKDLPRHRSAFDRPRGHGQAYYRPTKAGERDPVRLRDTALAAIGKTAR